MRVLIGVAVLHSWTCKISSAAAESYDHSPNIAQAAITELVLVGFGAVAVKAGFAGGYFGCTKAG
jgi:hypothetical protein